MTDEEAFPIDEKRKRVRELLRSYSKDSPESEELWELLDSDSRLRETWEEDYETVWIESAEAGKGTAGDSTAGDSLLWNILYQLKAYAEGKPLSLSRRRAGYLARRLRELFALMPSNPFYVHVAGGSRWLESDPPTSHVSADVRKAMRLSAKAGKPKPPEWVKGWWEREAKKRLPEVLDEVEKELEHCPAGGSESARDRAIKRVAEELGAPASTVKDAAKKLGLRSKRRHRGPRR